MKDFTFKNYPPKILISLILILTIATIVVQHYFNHTVMNTKLLVAIFACSGTISTILYYLNRYCKWNWVYRLLGIYYLGGKYKGTVTSSFYVNDDPANPQIELNIEMEICQNLNDIQILGTVWMNDIDGKTSDFNSKLTNLEILSNGKFLLEYKYASNSNPTHKKHKELKLTSHFGFASLEYDPKSNPPTLEGYYTTYENQSRGRLMLRLEK